MKKSLTFGSLFAGIGGFDLGFERAGLRCKWQVEIDPYCRRVLAEHWPTVPRHDDVRTFPTKEGDWDVDVICGGFPCQDISNAGGMLGIEKGERSGLWREYLRIIREIRPEFVVVENVAAILCRGRGMDRVLGDLSKIGFDAEWSIVSACSVGYPHMRKRVFILAYSRSHGREYEADSFAGGRHQKGDLSQRRGLPESEGLRSSPYAELQAEGYFASGFCGSPNGFPDWMDRIRGLGNAVAPQIAERIGLMLLDTSTTKNTNDAK